MNGNMKLLLELVANNRELRNGLNSGRRDVHTFVTGAKKEFESLKGMATSLQGRLATLGIGIGVGKIVMDSARLDKSLTQIGQTAGEGTDKVKTLRKELFSMAGESGQGVENLRDGFNVLVQSGLNMKESRATLDGINVAMSVTGAQAHTLAGGLSVASTAFQFDLSKPGMALQLLDKMTVAGRLGNAELENLSDIFARVGVNAKSGNMGFDQTLGFIEALSRVERQPERLATLADSTLRVFTNLRYMADAQKGTGVKFFDAKGARRDVFAVLGDIKKKYDTLTTDKQRAVFIQKAFGKADLDTVKGIKTLLQGDNLTKAGEFTSQISKASGTLRKDFDEATRNLVDQTGRMGAKLREAADGFVTPINKALAEYMKFIMADKKDGGLGLDGKKMILGGGALIAGTALTARYGGKAISGMADKLLKKGGSTAAGVAEGKALQYAAGVTPVFVVNADAIGGGIVNATTAGTAGAAATSGISGMAAAGTAALPALLAALVGGGSIFAGKKLSEYQATNMSTKGLQDLRARQMVMGGGPNTFQVKTIDAELARRSWSQRQDAFTRRFIATESAAPQVTNDIKIDINLDELGRAFARTNSMNTNTSVNSMRRGSFMTPIENSAMGSEY